MSQKVKKVHNFLDPPQKKHKLKHLKLPKNHFKTNLFFVQQGALIVYIYISVKSENSDSQKVKLLFRGFLGFLNLKLL